MASFRLLFCLSLASMLVFTFADNLQYYAPSSSSQSSGHIEGSGESSGEMTTTESSGMGSGTESSGIHPESSGIETPPVGSDVPANIEESSGLHSGEEFSGHSGEEFSGQSGEEFSGQSGEEFSGQSGEEFSGQSGEEFSGHSGEEFSGHSGEEFSGHSGEEFSGHSVEEFSGQSAEEFSGHSGEESSGESMGHSVQYRYRRSVHFRQGDMTTSTESTTEATTPVTTATTTPFTTTSTSTKAPGTVGNASCVPAQACFADADCGVNSLGRAGHCIGVFHGTCDCTRCITGLVCHDDSACGGLIGACNVKTKFCNCLKGYQQNGFATLGKALTQFCNHRACDGTTDTCFGLSCRKGLCAC